MHRIKSDYGRLILLTLTLLCVMIAVIILGSASRALAADFTVDSVDDATDATPGDGACATASGACTLRAAIQEANAFTDSASPDGNRILLPEGNYVLILEGASEEAAGTGDLDLTNDISIEGDGKAATTVDGGNIDRVFDVKPNAQATISGVSVTGGDAGFAAGGGVRNRGNLELNESAVTANAADFGGGLENDGGGFLALKDSTVEGNEALDGYGGGVYSGGGSQDSILRVEGSTFSNNTASEFGGGVYSSGNSRITNSTIVGNEAFDLGGGIRSFTGSLTLTNVTLSGNSAFDGSNVASEYGAATLTNTIVSDGAGGANCSGDPVSSGGGNLDSGASCRFSTASDLNDAAPGLESLRDNGGPTPTRALPLGSPAVDAGIDDACPSTDQRGAVRPLDGDGDSEAVCDVGAYELLLIETNIDSGPSGLANSRSAAFSLSSNGPNATFECSLDGQEFAECSSPAEYGELSDGEHHLLVRAVGDTGEADRTPATRSWTVDATPPTVVSVTPPENASDTALDANITARFSEEMVPETINDATVKLIETESTASDPVAAEVSYEAAARTMTLDPNANLDRGTGYTALIVGGTSGSKDPAGNSLAEDKSWSFSTVTDSTPPQTAIDSGPEGYVSSKTAAFSFTSSKPSSTFECRMDEGSFSLCASPRSYGPLAEGLHTFEVRAIDSQGNRDLTPASHTWRVDSINPSVSDPASSFVVASTLGATAGSSDTPVKIDWTGGDGYGSGITKYELQRSVNHGAWSADLLNQSPVQPAQREAQSEVTLNLSSGIVYGFRVRGLDQAGNWSEWVEMPIPFSVMRYQENGTGVTYPTGTWTRQAYNWAYGGYSKYAVASGSRARFVFSDAREVAWTSSKASNRGRATVLLNGSSQGTLDLYSSTSKFRHVAFRKGGLNACNNHSVEVRPTGTKNASSTGKRVDIDAFLIMESYNVRCFESE